MALSEKRSAPGNQPGVLPQLTFADTINLPGTTDTNQKGQASTDQSADSLTQPYGFVGPCWYEQDITIPGTWRGMRVTLLIERTRYTQVWLDGHAIGDNAILCTPQIYELGSRFAGRHAQADGGCRQQPQAG